MSAFDANFSQEMTIKKELGKASTAVGLMIAAGATLLSIPIAIGINLWMTEKAEPLYEVHDTAQIFDASKPAQNIRVLDGSGSIIKARE